MTAPLIAGVLWLLGFAVLFRIPRCRDREADEGHPSLAIVIPARNEESNLPTLLASLAGQEPAPAEIIVVDDASSDRTAEVARAGGARVMASTPPPEGWRGKTWACWQGAQASTGDVILFVDADTFFEAGGLKRIVDTYAEADGAMSVGPYHRVRRPYEELSAVFNIVMTAGTGAFTVLGSRLQPRGLFGQFLMVDRETYFAQGGHESVRGEVIENYCLASRFRAAGVPMRCYGGKGVFGMRMYPDGLRALVAGWTKSFAAGATRAPLLLVLMLVAWIGGGILTFLGLLFAGRDDFVPWALLYVLFALQIESFLVRIGSFRPWTALAYPVPLLFYVAVFTRSFLLMALGRRVSWKGREVATPIRPGK